MQGFAVSCRVTHHSTGAPKKHYVEPPEEKEKQRQWRNRCCRIFKVTIGTANNGIAERPPDDCLWLLAVGLDEQPSHCVAAPVFF